MTQYTIFFRTSFPETELAARRIDFYRRNGLFLNTYPYIQPPLAAGQQSVPLRLMTSGSALSPTEFEAVKTLLYREVYHFE